MKLKDESLTSQLQTETTAAEPQVEELLAFAQDLMLSKPPQQKNSASPPYLIHNSWQARGKDEEIRGDIPPELPEIKISIENAEAIEQLGRDMLDEAFECLGQRGKELYEEYLTIDENDTDAKVDICIELLKVVSEMSEHATFDSSKEDLETMQYSPFRLSPKIIGQHPDTNLNPTCLGKSILATSFFYKLGLPILHAGVVVSRNDSSITSQAIAMRNVIAATKDIGISPNYVAKLKDGAKGHIEALYKHNGFHATSYVQLNEEAWVQVDPNYGNLVMRTDIRERLTDAHTELQQDRASGIFGNEKTLLLGTDPSIVTPLVIETLRDIVTSPETLEQQLIDLPVNNLIKKLEREISDILLNTDPETDILSPVERMGLDKTLDTIAGSSKEAWVKMHVSVELTKAFIDEDGSYDDPFMLQAFERIKTDKHYRKRRVADLYLAPFNVLLQIQSTHALTPSSRGVAHSVVTAGLPEYRIGMSVLSDVAAFYGDELPLSTWLSYWPSIIGLVEHREQLTSEAQKHLAKAAISFFKTDGKALTPKSSADIIESVLAEIDPKGE